MTQDEIIEMAQECGLVGMRPHLDGIYIESLVAFAKLVAEAEQDADSFCDSNCVWTDHHPDCKLAQPEQEPVQYKCTVIDDQHSNGIPLEQWVKPPQRTWVGLTDEEQRDIAYSDINCWDWGELMDAVEAKLKEKNT